MWVLCRGSHRARNGLTWSCDSNAQRDRRPARLLLEEDPNPARLVPRAEPAGPPPPPSAVRPGPPDLGPKPDPAGQGRRYGDPMHYGPCTGLAAVSTALLAMSRRLEVHDVLRTIVASARELLDAEYAALGVPDDHGGFAQFVVDGISEEQWRRIGPVQGP